MPNPVERGVSEVGGVARTAAAALGRLSGLLMQVAKEYVEVTILLLRIRTTSDPAKRRALGDLF
jgi:hypothetical protein